MIEEFKHVFGDNKRIDILQAISKRKRFHIREISKLTGVPLATTFRIVKHLIKVGIIIEDKRHGYVTYLVNHENKVLDFLKPIFSKDPMAEFVGRLRQIESVQQVVRFGEKKTGEENIIVVGNPSKKQEINKHALEIEEKYKFKITFGLFAADQYQQMVKLGIFPGKKEILFSQGVTRCKE